MVLITQAEGKVRHYYIASEDVTWDYAPSGMDLLGGRVIPFLWAGRTRWAKTRYIEYTDSTFSVRKPQPEWLGILGPIIRAEVGDSIVVDFLNRSHLPHSIHPHGLRYDKASEGAFYLPAGTGSLVPPGMKFTYHWFADEGSGPGKGQPSSIVWWYHAHTDEPTETNAGLLGPIIVTAKGKARADGTPKGVDREFVALFMIFDEMLGKDQGMFHSINGYIFGNLPGLVMKQGEHVRWYLLAMGNEKDLHSPHWHGETVAVGNRHTDVVELLPGSMVTMDMVADNPGTWLFHCHVSDHMEAGMMAAYTIYQPQGCSSPLRITSADFWHTPGTFRVTVKNISSKPTRNIFVDFDYLMTPQYRRRSTINEWRWDATIQPGQEQTFEMQGFRGNLADSVFGWVLFPTKVIYQNDSSWSPQQPEQCFQIFWRDQDHPSLEVLPPLFVEIGTD
jgi:manganese oxidase